MWLITMWLVLAWNVEIQFAGRVFGIGNALEHKPQRDVAEKFAVGEKRRMLLRRGRGEWNRHTPSVGEKIHSENVAHRALGCSVATDQDYGNLRLAKARNHFAVELRLTLKRLEEYARDFLGYAESCKRENVAARP